MGRRRDDYDYSERSDISYRRKGAFGEAFGMTTGCLLGVGAVFIGIPVVICAGCLMTGALIKKPAPTEATEPAKTPPGVIELTDATAVDFADAPEKYKGKTVRIRAFMNVFNNPRDLRKLAGKEAKLTASVRTATIDFAVQLPARLDLPNAKDIDNLMVTFECRAGRLDSGNVATAVERAK